MAKKIITKNKKAYYDYEILEKLEAGVILSGPEVKSTKTGHINLKGSYVTISGGEVYLLNCHISPYKFANLSDYNPTISRKLLLHKREINHLIGKLQTKGISLIPLQVYIRNNLIKIEIGIARGKKKYDKREVIKKREREREIKRALKKY
jgi:SsrA-binding protein